MKKDGIYEVLVSDDKLFCSYNIYIENCSVGFRRNLNHIESDNRIDYFVEDCSSSALQEALDFSIKNQNKVDDFISYYQKLDVSHLSVLQKELSESLSIGYIEFENEKSVLRRNIFFNHLSIDKTTFDYIFLHQFGAAKMEVAIRSALSLLEEAISKNLKQELKVRDMKVFEEVFLIEGRKATYYGFLDNAKADVRQPIFEMETSLLIVIFETFYKMFFDNYNQTTPPLA